MLGVWLLGAVYTPSLAATAVAVAQQPLTLQPTIPPNVVLMLDDSGSMAWDVMPDYGYVGATPGSPTASELTSSSVNGLYYNPNITYSPPNQADGTLYNAATFTAAWIDGFHTGNGTVNLTTYDGSSDTSQQGTNSSNIGYTQSFTVASSGTPYTPTNCPSGYSIQTNGQCMEQPYPASCPFNYTLQTSGKNAGKCVKNTNQSKTATPTCQGTDTYSSTTFLCTPNPVVTTPPTCNSSSDTYDPAANLCTPQGTASTYSFFTYTVKNTDGSFTSHYVGLSGTCLLAASAGMTSSNCDERASTQKNVANWYSYYHTRILMAKSGLMVAFSVVDPTFRVGFGSINGNFTDGIPSPQYPFDDSAGYGTGNSNNLLAEVQPFGTTQKAAFWNWIIGESAGNGTPLRSALDKVGRYYKTSQPWTTMSTDPNYGTANQPSNIACRQAYTILTTDGFWNDSYSSSAESGASSAAWPTVTGPNGQTWPKVSGSSPAAPYSGGSASSGPSLADVAMYYWENDLQPDTPTSPFPNEVPPSTEDPAFWQHMTTFTMGLGFTPSGIAGKASNGDSPPTISDIFSAANGGLTLSNFSWPTPASNSINNIADLAHAAVNGHGGFYSATSPSTFVSGLTDALTRASERVGTGASLAANSTQLTNGTVAYQANYYTAKWKGDLKAFAIDSSTGAISTTPTWTAATALTAIATVSSTNSSVLTYDNRNIVTYVPPASTTGSGTFVAFQNSSSAPPVLSNNELTALGSTAAAQMTMVSYLRGDNTLEQKNSGNYRDRDTPLGDIVDSQPVYSGAPNPNEFENQAFTGITATSSTTDNSFQTWAVGTTNSSGNPVASAASTRTPLVFVAANDGMLHAFNASTGAEVYAYLPGAVITANLADLANSSYGSTTVPHQYYNDGELTIADAFFNSTWHTVLVGTTGRGPAEAVYALDITNPASITPLWERSANDGNTSDSNSTYIGQMVGKPVIAKVQDGTSSDWQVLIGNGYNSASGTAALLEFDIATGTLSVHTTTSRSGVTTGNGLAAPVTWMDTPTNGISTEAYAGDLHGQVWRFPLGKTQGNNYQTDPSTLGGVSATGTVVFSTPLVSNGTANVPQPITAGMLAGSDPTTSNVWLFFGTGQYLSSSDLSNHQVESWYGVIAQPGGSSTPTSNATVSSLVQRSIIYEQDGNPSATPPTLGVRVVTPLPTTSDMSGKLGWWMNLEAPTGTNGALVAQGERMVTPNQFQGNLLLGTTRIPVVTDICNPSGSGWVMAVNPFTGTNPTAGFFLGAGGGGMVTYTYTSSNGTVVTGTAAAAGVGFSSLPNNPIFVGGDMLTSFDNGTTASLNTSGSTGATTRVSWQELVNP
ncbi:type IV pilus assembly protein PilY1 [Rhodanobacter sp. OK091]|nr:type IV pilus assembly protein PilY1 [Rhodanobacter sp. OK091]